MPGIKSVRRAAVMGLALVLTVGPSLPAVAHGNHDVVVLASNAQAGPFQVSVWAPEGPPVVGNNWIAVQVSGDGAESVTVFINDATSTLSRQVVALQRVDEVVPRTWIGAVRIDSESEHQLMVVVNEGSARSGSLVIPVVRHSGMAFRRAQRSPDPGDRWNQYVRVAGTDLVSPNVYPPSRAASRLQRHRFHPDGRGYVSSYSPSQFGGCKMHMCQLTCL